MAKKKNPLLAPPPRPALPPRPRPMDVTTRLTMAAASSPANNVKEDLLDFTREMRGRQEAVEARLNALEALFFNSRSGSGEAPPPPPAVGIAVFAYE